jgi:ESS family glutamate:Na+ symporter
VDFWNGPVLDLLILLSCVTSVVVFRRLVPSFAALGVPSSMAAGLIALIAGPSVLGVLHFDPATFETVVYHGLALVFIAVALMPREGEVSLPGARSVALAIPVMTLLQAIVGLVLVLIASASTPVHPGYGLEMPLGFSQGPGQALSLGRAWEGAGMTDGGQYGLAVAALGFIGSCVIGVPMIHLGRRYGIAQYGCGEGTRGTVTETAPAPAAGEVDLLTRQLGAIALAYLGTYGVLVGLTSLAGDAQKIVDILWGFHFLVGFGVGVVLRRVLTAVDPDLLHGPTLRRVNGLVVDAATASAFAAVQLAVLGDYLVPLAVLTLLGMSLTLACSVWVAKRAFPHDPFGYAIALFGVSTGTLATALALLRAYDPEVEGPAMEGLVRGAPAAILPAAPMLLVFLPMATAGWPETHPQGLYATIGVMVVYCAFLIGVWRLSGHLQFLGPLWSFWPERADEA